MVIIGPPGHWVEVIDSEDKRLHRGVIKADRKLRFVNSGYVDPMHRLVVIDGVRRSLAELFPPVELRTVLDWNLTPGPVIPFVRAVHDKTGQPMAGIKVVADLLCRKARHVAGFSDLRVVSSGRATTSDQGVALSSPALIVPSNAGLSSCKLRVRAVGTTLRAPVTVRRKPRVAIVTDRAAYRPGDAVGVRVVVLDGLQGLPWGKAKAEIRIMNSKGKVLSSVVSETSASGVLHTNIVLPKRYRGGSAGLWVRVGDTTVDLRLSVVRTTKHRRRLPRSTRSARAGSVESNGGLLVHLVADSGQLLTGMANRVWVITTTKNGTPVSASVRLYLETGGQRTDVGALTTDDDGLAPTIVNVSKGASHLRAAAQVGGLRASASQKVARPKKRVARLHVTPANPKPGATLRLALTAPGRTGFAVFEATYRGQTVVAKSAVLSASVAETTLVLPTGLTGAVDFHAWCEGERRMRVGDVRRVVVADPRDLTVHFGPNPSTLEWMPGETASIDVRVTDASGAPVRATVAFTGLEVRTSGQGLKRAHVASERAQIRLGTPWNSKAAGWDRNSLYLQGRWQGLAMLAAADARTIGGRLRSWQMKRRRDFAEVFDAVMQRRVLRISGALTRYYQGDPSRKEQPVTVAKLVEVGELAASDSLDPWHRPLTLTLEPLRDCKSWVAIRSVGIDGTVGYTARGGDGDDLTASTSFHGYFKKPRRCTVPRSHGVFGFGGSGGGSGRSMGVFPRAVQERTAGPWPRALAAKPAVVQTDAQGKATWRVVVPKGAGRWVIQARAVSGAGGLGGAEKTITSAGGQP